MNIYFGVVGKVVVDDMGEVVDVESACGHIGGYQQLKMPVAEPVHDDVALFLGEVAVKGVGVIAVADQVVGHFLVSARVRQKTIP